MATMASKKRKTKQWKKTRSRHLIKQTCSKKGKALDDPYWKREIASVLSGCEFPRRRHKDFNEKV